MISRIKKNHISIIFTCIVLYCTYLLIYKLWFQSLRIDEWYSSYISKYMSIDWLYKSKYFLFEWLQVLFFKIGWIDDYWARVPSILAQIGSLLLMYFIPYKLTQNKYIWLFSSLIFGLLYRELGWWRDARFYALLQVLFLWWIALIIKRIETKNTAYLNSAIILSGLWMIFHPFLYVLWAILFITILRQYKKIRDFNSLFSKKFLTTRILIIIWLVWVIIYWTLWWTMKWSLTSGLPFKNQIHYFSFYNSHLRTHLWLIYIIWLLWMIHFFIKKSYKEIILFFVPLILFIYALTIRWYLMHSRYALLIFPIIILSACIFTYDIIKTIWNKYTKRCILAIILTWAICTANFQFLPSENYYFDYTSPQPDFKWAYKPIPNDKNVISGFPTLCDRYYSDRWTCINAIRVDLIHDWKSKVTKKESESYTKIPYISSLDDLDAWEYYFVIDNLTNKSSSINKDLFNQISEYGQVIFENGESHNNIIVFKVLIED